MTTSRTAENGYINCVHCCFLSLLLNWRVVSTVSHLHQQQQHDGAVQCRVCLCVFVVHILLYFSLSGAAQTVHPASTTPPAEPINRSPSPVHGQYFEHAHNQTVFYLSSLNSFFFRFFCYFISSGRFVCVSYDCKPITGDKKTKKFEFTKIIFRVLFCRWPQIHQFWNCRHQPVIIITTNHLRGSIHHPPAVLSAAALSTATTRRNIVLNKQHPIICYGMMLVSKILFNFYFHHHNNTKNKTVDEK